MARQLHSDMPSSEMKKTGRQDALRYYMHDGPRTFRFELSGPLTGSGARSLEQDWRTASSVAADKTLIVDLSFVSEIDAVGLDLMQAWYRGGAQFVAKSAQGRALIESVTGEPAEAPSKVPAQETHGAYRPWMSLKTVASLVGLMLLLVPSPVLAEASPNAAASLAFGRYVASLEQSAPFSGSGETVVDIEASLPGMEKRGHLMAIRHAGVSPESEYEVVRTEGDPTVKSQVIARYLSAQLQTEALPASSIAVTPANYNFRYMGSIQVGDSPMVYVFDISPKQKRDGLLQGQLWIDAQTGIAVRQTGFVVKKPSVFIRRIAIVRDLQLSDGTPSGRTTRVEIDTRIVGRAELTITERPLSADEATNFERGIQ